MDKYEEINWWPTSYALKADELYLNFPTKKYIRIKPEELPREYNGHYRELYGQIFRYFFYLLINDIIENHVTFKFPPNGGIRNYLEMVPIHGEDFKRARQNGAFDDVDFLASNFTGYQIYLRTMTRYGKWLKQLHVSKKFKNRITELTNQGKGW